MTKNLAVMIGLFVAVHALADDLKEMNETPVFGQGADYLISGGAILTQPSPGPARNYTRALAVRIVKDAEGPRISVPAVGDLVIGSGYGFSVSATDNLRLDSISIGVWTGIGKCTTITTGGSFLIPSQYITTKGMRIEIEAVDYAGNRTHQDLFPRLLIGTKRGGVTRPGRWSMVAIPGKIDSLEVEKFLTARWGNSDGRNWRAVRYNGNRYVEAGEVGFKTIKSGQAFWLYPQENEYLDIGTVDAFELKDTLLKILPGWNQVGSPFKFDLNNKRVQVEDSLGTLLNYSDFDIYRTEYNDTIQAYDNIPIKIESEDFKEGEGYWIKNPFQGNAYIRYAVTGNVPTGKPAVGEWVMRIGTREDRYNYIGETGMREGWRMEEPPSVGKNVGGGVTVEGCKGVFKNGTAGQMYLLTIKAKEEKKLIEWEHNAINKNVGIINCETGQELEVKAARGSGEFWVIENDKIFVVAGTAEYYERVKKDLLKNVPGVTEVRKAYPNPFNPSLTVEYSLKSALTMWEVSLRIYDARGRLVNTLVNQKEKPGYRLVRWSGRDGNGLSAATGIYFLRFKARSGEKEYIKTIKTLMVK